jgi:UDP-N-acetylglucosamine 3-dehydrogenase
MIKVGVIGLGAMGQHHARIYSQLNCELVGVADSNIDRAKEISEKYHTKYYPDYKTLIGKVDAINIAVPTSLHHEVAMDFLKNGVHCLVEKPIAVSLEQANDMIKMAESKHVNLAIGHIERFNPAVMKLKQIVDSGTLGKLLIISTRRVGPSASRIRDVGIVIDSATHDIGVIKYLVGKEPLCVFSRVGSLKHAKEDHAVIVLDFNDTAACIEVNWFTPQKIRTLVATGSEGIAYLDYIDQTLKILNSHETKTIDIIKAEPLKLELEDFLNSISGTRQPAVNGTEAKAILKIALQSEHNNYCVPSINSQEESYSTVQSNSVKYHKIIAAIPCFNTEKTIGDMISKSLLYVSKVIIIDDGSTDKTVEIAKAAGAIVVSHGMNKGYGAAIRSCLAIAKHDDADALVIIDGDGQHNPAEIPLLLNPIIENKADLVIGSRFLTSSTPNTMPRYRKFGIRVINFLWNFGSQTKITDTQSGFRAYGKSVMHNLDLKENGMSISIEILEQIKKKKPVIKEIPISCLYDENSSSLNAKSFYHGICVALSVIKIRIKYIFKN